MCKKYEEFLGRFVNGFYDDYQPRHETDLVPYECWDSDELKEEGIARQLRPPTTSVGTHGEAAWRECVIGKLRQADAGLV
jgi:hypothetical protein